MNEKYTKFAHLLMDDLIQHDIEWTRGDPEVVTIKNPQKQLINLNLTPFDSKAANDVASEYFEGVKSIEGLIDGYNYLNKQFKFESVLPELVASVSEYANEFINITISEALHKLLDEDAILIMEFVKDLDCYTAVKSIESLLYSHSDLELLRIAKSQSWKIHFDHVAIRCGSSSNNSARKVAELLIKEYGYSHPQINTEKFYLFNDGWSAYPLYKILSNGQVLRVFVDQSESSHPFQIIQHWNQVYGFTAHHLALRASKVIDGKRVAVKLPEIITLMEKSNRAVLSPTGYYTNGLLSQVFTKPEKNMKIPNALLEEKRRVFENLPEVLVNAKLLEIVSRKEMNTDLARKYFELYDLEYDSTNDLHSAVFYQYFLPAQAAHVIKSSEEV